jgi:hypothetical protein
MGSFRCPESEVAGDDTWDACGAAIPDADDGATGGGYVTDVMRVCAPDEVSVYDVAEFIMPAGAPPCEVSVADVTEFVMPAGVPPEVSVAAVTEFKPFKPAGAEPGLSDAVLRGLCDGVHEVVQRHDDDAVAYRWPYLTVVFYGAYYGWPYRTHGFYVAYYVC